MLLLLVYMRLNCNIIIRVLLKLMKNSNYLITGSKDGYIICHPAEGAYKPMDYCNKYGLAFDLDSTFAFTNNNKKLKTQSKSYRNISLVSSIFDISTNQILIIVRT